MNLGKILVVNRKIVVTPADDPAAPKYPTVIQNVSAASFGIQVPSHKGQQLILHKGDRVEAEVYGEGARYIFTTVVLGREKDRVPLYLLARPATASRIQDRQFVRVATAFEAFYQVVDAAAGEQYQLVQPTLKGTALDISGGGLQLAAAAPVEPGVSVVISFILPGSRIELKLPATVKRVQTREVGTRKVFLLGLVFEKISEREQEEIIAYVFRKQVEDAKFRR